MATAEFLYAVASRPKGSGGPWACVKDEHERPAINVSRSEAQESADEMADISEDYEYKVVVLVTVHAPPRCGQPLVMGEDESGLYCYCPQCDCRPPDDEVELVPLQPLDPSLGQRGGSE